jgi:hypothetical protein
MMRDALRHPSLGLRRQLCIVQFLESLHAPDKSDHRLGGDCIEQAVDEGCRRENGARNSFREAVDGLCIDGLGDARGKPRRKLGLNRDILGCDNIRDRPFEDGCGGFSGGVVARRDGERRRLGNVF